MMMLAKRAFAVALLMFPAVCRAQAPSLDQFNWLVGVWHAHVAGGELQSVYGPIFSNEIVGSLEQEANGKPVRYEMRSIRAEGGKIVYQILAYGPGLVAGRPPAVKTLISADATEIKFNGIDLKHTGTDTMTAILDLKQPDGSTKTVSINFARVQHFAP